MKPFDPNSMLMKMTLKNNKYKVALKVKFDVIVRYAYKNFIRSAIKGECDVNKTDSNPRLQRRATRHKLLNA